jgi:hypothetical protein
MRPEDARHIVGEIGGIVRQLLWLALAVTAAPAQTTASPHFNDVAVYYNFQHEPESSVIEAFEHETASILSPMGDPIAWRPMEEGNSWQPTAQLAVLTFLGDCNALSVELHRSNLRALGITHLSDGEIIPFSEIDCDSIHEVVDGRLTKLTDKERKTMFARAMGRVVAHELYHILAHTSRHTPVGIAKASFTTHDLIDGELSVEELSFHSSPKAEAVPSGCDGGQRLFAEHGCATCHGRDGKGTVFAPTLARGPSGFNVLSLAAKLSDTTAKMYRVRRKMKIKRPAFTPVEMRSLAEFLNNLRPGLRLNAGAPVGTTDPDKDGKTENPMFVLGNQLHQAP